MHLNSGKAAHGSLTCDLKELVNTSSPRHWQSSYGRYVAVCPLTFQSLNTDPASDEAMSLAPSRSLSFEVSALHREQAIAHVHIV